MIINLTLVVQAFNFFIAYLLIRYVLLRPALGVLDAERAVRRQFLQEIENIKQSLTVKEQERKKRWQECQEYMAQQKPPLEVQDLYIFKDITPSLTAAPLDQRDITKAVNAVADALRSQVDHVI
jgi:hypothetical protein